jgi:hypothetical protein
MSKLSQSCGKALLDLQILLLLTNEFERVASLTDF